MPSKADQDAIIRELFSRVKVAIEWEGYEANDKKNAFDVAEEFGHTYPLGAVKAAAEYSRKSYASSPNPTKFRKLQSDISDLETEVIKVAKSIGDLIDSHGKTAAQIKPNYYDQAVKDFASKNKEKCVVLAPDLWLPDMFT